MPQAAVPEAQAIVIDTETTGLTDSDELLQISVIDDAGTVLFDSLVRPYFHTEWPEAQKVNGITPEMVAGAAISTRVVTAACRDFLRDVCLHRL